MYLILDSDTDYDFIAYLIKMIRIWLTTNVDQKKLIPFQDFVSGFCDTEVNAKELFKNMIYSIKYVVTPENILILVSNTQVITINNRLLKICDLAQLLNYGNTTLQGYPIFTKMIEHVQENLEVYNLMWRDKIYIPMGD